MSVTLGKLSQLYLVPRRNPLRGLLIVSWVPCRVPHFYLGILSPLVGGKKSILQSFLSVLQAMLSLGIIAALSQVCSGIQDSLSWIVDNLDQKKDLPSYAGPFFSGGSLSSWSLGSRGSCQTSDQGRSEFWLSLALLSSSHICETLWIGSLLAFFPLSNALRPPW